jgi:hypothetical protein
MNAKETIYRFTYSIPQNSIIRPLIATRIAKPYLGHKRGLVQVANPGRKQFHGSIYGHKNL